MTLAADGKNARTSSRPEPIVGKLGALHTRCPAEVAIDWLDRHDGGDISPIDKTTRPRCDCQSLTRFPFVLAIPQKYTTEPQARRAGYLLCDVSKQQVARLMLRAT